MPQSRFVTIGEQSVEVVGLASDPYFRSLDNASADNEALFHTIWTGSEPGAVILDVGANIGLTTVLFSRVVPGSVVWSFEPAPQAHDCLLQTLARNGLPRDRVRRIALGAKQGVVRFNQSEDMLAGSHIVSDTATERPTDIHVPMTTLDKVADEVGHVDFVKIDVEGFELDVLRGAQRMLGRLTPRVILEFNSYTLIAHANISPRAALDAVMEIFPVVQRWRAGAWHRVRSNGDKQKFIRENLVEHACVDELLCAFTE